MSFDKSFLRQSELPTIFCPGCGHGVVTQAFLRTVKELGWDKDDVFSVSGIGCSARIPAYCNTSSVQTTHGRALAFATGMKMTRPEKHVVLFLGDGDCTAIGGNHFLHACRRNIDMTVIILNNYIYGMTGGQASPATPHGAYSSTSPYGNIDEQIDICQVAVAAGASFVARSTVYHAQQLPGIMKKAFNNHGLSVIEVLGPCPTGFGRQNKFRDVGEMYDFLRDATVSTARYEQLSPEEKEQKIPIGIFRDVQRPEYIDKYNAMAASIKSRKEPEHIECKSSDGGQIGRFELTFAGSGGQGLVLAGIILSETMIRQGKFAVHTQSYGPEARGGSSKSEVVMGDGDIDYPEVLNADLLVAMTQASYDKYRKDVKKGGLIIADTTYVTTVEQEDVNCLSIPISQICSTDLGDIRCANIMTLGILAGKLGFIEYDALRESVLARLAPKLHDLNIKALEAGYALGRGTVGKE